MGAGGWGFGGGDGGIKMTKVTVGRTEGCLLGLAGEEEVYKRG